MVFKPVTIISGDESENEEGSRQTWLNVTLIKTLIKTPQIDFH